jgi:hypothetical protein
MRYIGAISDADILINLARVNRLNILNFYLKKSSRPNTTGFLITKCNKCIG